MRILNGTKVIAAEPGWGEALLHGGRRVVIDLGAGDGRFAYESARNDAASVYVAVDPDAAALAAYAFRACRKPAPRAETGAPPRGTRCPGPTRRTSTRRSSLPTAPPASPSRSDAA